jgi:hypothetical protein
MQPMINENARLRSRVAEYAEQIQVLRLDIDFHLLERTCNLINLITRNYHNQKKWKLKDVNQEVLRH